MAESKDTFKSWAQLCLAPALCSNYAWVDALDLQNKLVKWNEDFDPVPPDLSCVQINKNPWDNFLGGMQSDKEDELTDCDTRSVTPEPATTAECYSSPLTPVPPSPTLTEVANGWPPCLITYSKADRKHFMAQCAEREAKTAAVKQAKDVAIAARRKHVVALTNQACGRLVMRQSTRLHRRKGPTAPQTAGIVHAEDALAADHTIHEVDPDALTPLVDKKGYIVGAIAGAPKGETLWWVHVLRHAQQAMIRLYRNRDFTNLGYEESRVQFGIGFGHLGAWPHKLDCKHVTTEDMVSIEHSIDFRALSAYHNHLYRQIAPKMHASLEQQLNLVQDATTLHMPFPDSVFTTSEILFIDRPQHARKNCEAQYDTMEALTICGEYNWWENRGRLIFWDDCRSILLKPGTTVLFPVGTKHFSFVGVEPGETICVFWQFCHASALRWLAKDCQSDTQFEAEVSDEELEAFKAERLAQPKASMRLYSKLDDHYIF
ncbi:hypothetical protein DFH07DRAFT_953023 [Mycena maculata]|uniref:Uncharacterized protein n=1 Tax=Mycena maculata TaxID=230809 RepID=A0AAD7JXF5_9AGAR|nr:hypothetical protein DFH07DRAFT_953023 [Mycena maculata]